MPAELRSTFREMGQVAERIVAEVRRRSSPAATSAAPPEIEPDDDAMDAAAPAAFFAGPAATGQHGAEAAVDITLLGRYYERFADHAVSVAARVVYLVTGEWGNEANGTTRTPRTRAACAPATDRSDLRGPGPPCPTPGTGAHRAVRGDDGPVTGDDEEFARFVAARWPALEGVALAGTLDGDASRAVTTTALAALRARWVEVLEDGAPTAAAQTALLERLSRWTPTAAPVAPLPTPVDPGDPVPPALLGALTHEEPLVRAALAAGPLWERGPEEVAALLGRTGRDLPSRVEAARGRLLLAHREALAAEGLAPADHRLDADLETLLAGLAAARPEAPDPAALVAHRTGRTRRRTLLLGGAGVAALGVVGWGAGHGPRGSTAAPAPSTTATPEPARWATTRTWPARGALVDDPEVRAAVSQADGGRLLWADEVQGVRAAVVAVPDPQQTGTVFRVWAGPLPAVGPLTEVQYPFNQLSDVPDLVALGLPRGSGAIVLVLAEPTAPTAEFSPVVRILASGEVERDWAEFPLDQGVGVPDLGLAPRDGRPGPLRPLRRSAAAAPGVGEESLLLPHRRCRTRPRPRWPKPPAWHPSCSRSTSGSTGCRAGRQRPACSP